ncbi:ABC transporter permease subunit [Planctomycetaceae bacterium SH139]
MKVPSSSGANSAWSRFISDYGMIFVLLLLIVLFSALTITEQNPTGVDAGRQVAARIVDRYGDSAGVIIVTRDTVDDRVFAKAIEARLADLGPTVLATVHGSPADARQAIEGVLARNESIDAVAANSATSNWVIYERFDEVGRNRLVIPEPYTWPNFLKLTNLLGVANQTAIYAIIAIGMTMVIITAGIDLSVGSLVALASVSGALLLRDFGDGAASGVGMMFVGMLVGVGICGFAGLFNGAMVTFFRLPSFIVTLGMMLMASGLAYRLSAGASIPQLPDSFFWIGGGELLGLPNPVWLMAVLYVIAHIVMTRTAFGRYVYAIGGNAEAARLSGVPVTRVLLIVYMLSGILAGLGGIVLASKLQAGDPKFGLMYELEVIAAVVVGGTSLLGGSGKIMGTLIGAFIIAVIKNGMNLTDVDPFNQKIVLGAVLLSAVLIDTLKRNGKS